MLQMAFKDRELDDAKRSAAERTERLEAALRQRAEQVGTASCRWACSPQLEPHRDCSRQPVTQLSTNLRGPAIKNLLGWPYLLMHFSHNIRFYHLMPLRHRIARRRIGCWRSWRRRRHRIRPQAVQLRLRRCHRTGACPAGCRVSGSM